MATLHLNWRKLPHLSPTESTSTITLSPYTPCPAQNALETSLDKLEDERLRLVDNTKKQFDTHNLEQEELIKTMQGSFIYILAPHKHTYSVLHCIYINTRFFYNIYICIFIDLLFNSLLFMQRYPFIYQL